MAETSIYQVFQAHEKELGDSLRGLTLPADAKKVQKIVETFLTSLFESDGDFRQSLTQSEDYILQAALQLLQAQQNISRELVSSFRGPSTSKASTTIPASNSCNGYAPIIGAGIGALAGGFIGTWAAVCGAIAGTAVVIYCANKPTKSTSPKARANASTEAQNPGIDINAFNAIIGKICQSIDNLMDTYRVQVKKVENIYSQKERPSRLSECQTLFNQLANLHKVVAANKADIPTKVLNAIDLLEESLENYGLTIKDGRVVNE
ncbi:MAG: hypothetical protein LUD17_11845 [Bacteroidales bacterium]|nr:hypothetical protein [Bacteroidales bacterium]